MAETTMMKSDAALEKALKRLLTNPLSMREILTRLRAPKAERTAIKRRIDTLATAGTIIRIKGGRYGLPEKMNLVTGAVQGHPDGFGFVIPDDPNEKDVFLKARSFNEAMHGDRVVARVESTRPSGKREGRVIRVLERANEIIVGRFEASRGGGYVAPYERRVIHDIFIPAGEIQGAKNGQAVTARITDYPSKTRQPQGVIEKILGDPDDPAVEALIVTAKHHIRTEFPAAALNEAQAIQEPGDPAAYAGRMDLRYRPIVTIDGETAKDYDDAVEVEPLPGGGWRLGVHIADVSHYVREGSALDKEAFTRGTSVYFPGSVTPMLPATLSNGICSLNPKVDRLTLSCLMTLDNQGGLVEYEITESVIRTVERMTYTAVAAVLDETDPEAAARYHGLTERFRAMRELAMLLRDNRRKNGAIDFDLPEPEFVLDMTGRPEQVIWAERNIAHIIIEEFMLMANRVVAGRLARNDGAGIFRVHDRPDPLKVEQFKEFIAAFGIRLKKSDTLTSKKMQELLDHFDGKPEEKLVTHVLLRSMKQARYSEENSGHFALAFEDYTHFTSPIRRYPDLVVHRMLKELLHGKRRKGYWAERTRAIAEHCSRTERSAEEAERDIIKLKQTQYMAGCVGEEFEIFVIFFIFHIIS